MSDTLLFCKKRQGGLRWAAALGPGILVMLADFDAGNVVSAAQSGARFGAGMLPVVLVATPLLFAIQELSVRLGVGTGEGFGVLIRERFGKIPAFFALCALIVTVFGTLITELSAVVGVGEMYGVARPVSLLISILLLGAVAWTRTNERMDYVALFIGVFEISFFAVVWCTHPGATDVVAQVQSVPYKSSDFAYLAAALVGASFNPWMIFYQQSAVAKKRLGLKLYAMAKAETLVGTVLMQALTTAVMLAAAGAIFPIAGGNGLEEIAGAFCNVVGASVGKIVFSVGVLAASLVAAIVSLRTLASGLQEICGRSGAGAHTTTQNWLKSGYVSSLLLSGVVVGLAPNLVSLNIGAQVLNAVLLPAIVAMLIVLSATVLPLSIRPNKIYLGIVGLATCCTACLVFAAVVVGAMNA